MVLKAYNEKRNFNSTKEPKGIVDKDNKNRFVIQYHEARAKHYDFRLEYKGVLLSWAVPKGLSLNSKDKRLAVHVEDHPIDYIGFEGIIPKGQYGAGTVKIYDSGIYIPISDFKNGIKSGNFKFYLLGSKLHGVWSLVKKDEKNWFIIKSNNDYILSTETKSKNPFYTASVELAILSNEIPKGDDWLFEIKYDGYRILTFVEKGFANFFTRNGKNYTDKINKIGYELNTILKNSSVVLDGEIVAFDTDGRSDFSKLQQSLKNDENNISYVVFDVLAFNGVDLRELPLISRKNILFDILKNAPKNIIVSEYIIGHGKDCFALAKKKGLEGVMAKRIDSKYMGERNGDWLKIKCYKRQEFVICGFTKTQKNKFLSSIIVGYYKNKNLIFAGKVGTGFSEKQREELSLLFEKNIITENKIKNSPENIICIKPKFVAEIQFSELTKNNVLRQPSFIGLRDDKISKEVVLESQNER